MHRWFTALPNLAQGPVVVICTHMRVYINEHKIYMIFIIRLCTKKR